MKKAIVVLCAASLALMSSCVGVSIDILANADGSGKINLEYRVSHMLESMGRLDGNARWPAIPVGKADFERTLARIPGMSLGSFASKEVNAAGGKELVTRVTLNYRDTAALLAFLDFAGSRAALVQKDGASMLRLILRDSSADITDTDLLALMREVFAGYGMQLTFSAPKSASLSVVPPSVASARLTPHGRKVSFAMDMGELLCMHEDLALEIAW